uniref:Neurotransmitter-gated ion-channel transmembrane domain-containing protein n=1 Tax=Trichobilharzia regenti TaxID=157069 RepID=A0AA85KCS1_TRIRE|nr:unnamed protein product [Trichobilharzia regenti]
MLLHASLAYTYRSTDSLTVWKPTTTTATPTPPTIFDSEQISNKIETLKHTKQTDLVLKLYLQRRSFFYIWNIVVPCILLTMLTLVTFWTPVVSGEKVTLDSERVPPTAKSIPLIGVYMTSVMTLTVGSVVACVIVINLDSRGEKLTRAPKFLRRLMQTRIIRLFYKDDNINKSAVVSSIIEKLSMSTATSQENKLAKINGQISALCELNQLLTKNEQLTKEIQSIYQDYLCVSSFIINGSNQLKKKTSPLHSLDSIYNDQDVLVEEAMNHRIPSPQTISASLLESSFLTSSQRDVNKLQNYLPLSIIRDSTELLSTDIDVHRDIPVTPSGINYSKTITSSNNDEENNHNDKIEKLSMSTATSQENKLAKINGQISALCELNQLLTKNEQLTKEIQSIYQDYLCVSSFIINGSNQLKKKTSPLHSLDSIYNDQDVLVEEAMNHRIPSPQTISASLLESSFLTSSQRDVNKLQNYLPLSIIRDSTELLSTDIDVHRDIPVTPSGINYSKTITSSNNDEENNHNDKVRDQKR